MGRQRRRRRRGGRGGRSGRCVGRKGWGRRVNRRKNPRRLRPPLILKRVKVESVLQRKLERAGLMHNFRRNVGTRRGISSIASPRIRKIGRNPTSAGNIPFIPGRSINECEPTGRLKPPRSGVGRFGWLVDGAVVVVLFPRSRASWNGSETIPLMAFQASRAVLQRAVAVSLAKPERQ